MYFDSSAKPKLSPPPILKLLIPMTSPCLLIKGPPEFPGFSAASVWMYAFIPFAPGLLIAETIPSETENCNPNGFPIAITFSPICNSSEFPISIDCTLLSIFNNAMS